MNVVAVKGDNWVLALRSSLPYFFKKRSYQPQELSQSDTLKKKHPIGLAAGLIAQIYIYPLPHYTFSS